MSTAEETAVVEDEAAAVASEPVDDNGEFERMKVRVDALNRKQQQLIELENEVAERESEWESAKKDAADRKKDFDAAVDRLRSAIRSRNDPQGTLPFPPVDEPGADAAENSIDLDRAIAETPLSAIGLSEADVDHLSAANITTCGDLQAAFNKHGGQWHNDIKGIGQAKAEKINERYAEWMMSARAEAPDTRRKRCLKDGCNMVYAGELTACPNCGENIYDRIDADLPEGSYCRCPQCGLRWEAIIINGEASNDRCDSCGCDVEILPPSNHSAEA